MSEVLNNQQLENIKLQFEFMDMQKRGVVSLREFVQAKKILSPLNSEYMSTSEFATFDLSGNGEITLQDLIHGYETIIGYNGPR